LPDDITIYPGHGTRTTIGAERKSNKYIRWTKKFIKKICFSNKISIFVTETKVIFCFILD
jgi:hypothetical protein